MNDKKMQPIIIIIVGVSLTFIQSYFADDLAKKPFSIESESKLVEILFKNYTKTIRPSDQVEIKFSFYLNSIITLVEKEQLIVLNVFVDHEWTDPRLVWNPDKHSHMKLLRIKCTNIWT